MATFTVTTTGDGVNAGDGRLSLREAVGRANDRAGADRVEFGQAVEGGRLVLTRGELVIDDDLRIDGSRDNSDQTTIDAGRESRVFRVDDAGTGAALEDVVVTGGYTSEAVGGTYQGGGLLLGENTALDLLRSTVVENTAGGYDGSRGGGIAASDGTTLSLVDSQILNNGGSDGGGIYAGRDTEIAILDSLLRGNSAASERTGNGGALFVLEGATTIESSTVSDNFAGYDAGAITAFGGPLTVTNSTIAGNVAGNSNARGASNSAGAITAENVILESSTVTGNSIEQNPGGYGDPYTGGIAADRLRVSNSIVAGNSYGTPGEPGTVARDIEAGTLVSNGHNVFGTDVAGSVDGDSEGEPLDEIFASIDPSTGGGRLALNGGETPTAALALESFNPALSGADTRTAPDVDQRGFVRPAPDGTNPDIGAFESRQNTTSPDPSPFNDAIVGSAAAETIRAQGGNDLLRGFAGNDQLFGEGGSDTLFAAGGNDRVFGGPGAELVSGGPDVDQLTGGPGRDAFDIDQGHTGVGVGNRDRLLDFDRDDDLIDLVGVDARGGSGGDQAFTFIGTAAFSGPGQLRRTTSGPDTLVQGNTDGDRSAELELQVAGRQALGADDFVL